jgi:hypothetical protein
VAPRERCRHRLDQRRDVPRGCHHRGDPPIFDSYCILELPQNSKDELKHHEQAVIELLSEPVEEQPWWLDDLDTGASDVVFPCAPG